MSLANFSLPFQLATPGPYVFPSAGGQTPINNLRVNAVVAGGHFGGDRPFQNEPYIPPAAYQHQKGQQDHGQRQRQYYKQIPQQVRRPVSEVSHQQDARHPELSNQQIRNPEVSHQIRNPEVAHQQISNPDVSHQIQNQGGTHQQFRSQEASQQVRSQEGSNQESQFRSNQEAQFDRSVDDRYNYDQDFRRTQPRHQSRMMPQQQMVPPPLDVPEQQDRVANGGDSDAAGEPYPERPDG